MGDTLEYNPNLLDDPQWPCGKHKRVLIFASYMVRERPHPLASTLRHRQLRGRARQQGTEQCWSPPRIALATACTPVLVPCVLRSVVLTGLVPLHLQARR